MTFSLYNYAKLRYVDLEHILSQKSSVNVDWKSTFKRANNKNLQFLPNQADIMAILPTHELVIFTKFHDNWIEIVKLY